MNDIIYDAVNKLSAITDLTPVNWDAFDAVLNGLEDINTYDERHEETILSEFIMSRDFYDCGTILVDIIRHFLSCGYDVSANEGMNGGSALGALCWSSYDRHILDAAKVLMNVGAPVDYRFQNDDPDEGSGGLIGLINHKLPGAWLVDKNFAYANILEAYYAITEANMAGKDYNSIDSYFACIGKPLTSVSAINVDGNPALQTEGTLSIYSEPLIMWFENKPLVISSYTVLVVNPVYSDNKKDDLVDVTTVFSSLIGATLQAVQHIGTTISYFEFSNGKRLFFASHAIGDKKRVGTFDIQTDSGKVDVEQLRIECFCGINGHTFADTVTEYNEDAIALFCEDTAYLLYLRQGTTDRQQLGLCPCSEALLAEYTRQYPLNRPSKITGVYEQNNLSAIRLDFPDGYLYMVATEYHDIGIRLSDELYDPPDDSALSCTEGKHMEFLHRKDSDQP